MVGVEPEKGIHRRKAGPPARGCNLVLVARPLENQRDDFERIGRIIRGRFPDVHPLVVEDGRRFMPHNLHLWMRPTMLFCPVRVNHFRLLRGRVFQGGRLSKSQECAMLEKAGVPVPRWAVLTPESAPDLSAFGPYVVIKPEMGSRGADVVIVRAGRVRWKVPRTDHARSNSALNPNWLVQQFIYTGPWPVSYRVTTLFGQALCSTRTEAARSRRPLEDRYAFKQAGGGLSIVSSGKGSVYTLENDPRIIALAEQAHRAFPDIPLLGVDVVREVPGGNLYVIEVNAGGRVWHFSSPTGRQIQEEFGLSLESQFDGINKAARILAEQARERAC